LLIEEATEPHLSPGAGVALAGGSALYVLAVLIAHSVTGRVAGRFAAPLKLGAIVAALALMFLAQAVPPVLTVALLLLLLVVVAGVGGTYLRALSSTRSADHGSE
jgi:hypothetical protein